MNFANRDGAIAAFSKRIFNLGGEQLDIAGFHK